MVGFSEVKKGLRPPAIGVVSGRAQRSRPQHEELHGCVKRIGGREAGWITVLPDAPAGCYVLAVSEGDEMLAPGTHLSLRVKACFQANRSTWTEGVVGNVVFARTEQPGKQNRNSGSGLQGNRLRACSLVL